MASPKGMALKKILVPGYRKQNPSLNVFSLPFPPKKEHDETDKTIYNLTYVQSRCNLQGSFVVSNNWSTRLLQARGIG
jgi:hypothetical protein